MPGETDHARGHRPAGMLNWSADAEREHLKQLALPHGSHASVGRCRANLKIENVWVAERAGSRRHCQCPAAGVVHRQRSAIKDKRRGMMFRSCCKVDGVTAAVDEKVDLQPGQTRSRISRLSHSIVESKTSQEPAAGSYLTAEVSIPASSVPFDRLPGDNMRSIVVPVIGCAAGRVYRCRWAA